MITDTTPRQSDLEDEFGVVCGNCKRSMRERSGNRWFCPSCVDYDAYLGAIKPNEPDHPMFIDAVKQYPELAVGWALHVTSHGTTEGEFIAIIDEYNADQDEYILSKDDEPPFDHVEYILSHEELVRNYDQERRGQTVGTQVYLA